MRWMPCLAASVLVCGLAQGQSEHGSRAESLVGEAIAFAKGHGKAKLLEATNFANGQFHIKKGDDLYLFIYNLGGTCLAHGYKVQLVGLNRYDAKDLDGHFYVRKLIEIAKTNGKGWTSYKYQDPSTGKVSVKTTFATLHEDLVICAGAYQD